MKKKVLKLSEYIYLKGYADGVIEYYNKGYAEGLKIAHEEIMKKNFKKECILGSINTLQSLQMPFETICEKMLEWYTLTPEQVVNYMKMKQKILPDNVCR